MVEKIIKKFGYEMGIDDYFEQVKAKNIDHRNYIRVKEVQCVF